MAGSGSFTGTTANSAIVPTITWSAAQSQEGNYSDVTAVLTYDRLLFQNPGNDATITCQFGDGVLEDTEKEFNRQLAMVQARVLKPEQLLQYHFQCTEEEARNLLPEQQDAGGLFDGGAF